jgi:hypothetical protein
MKDCSIVGMQGLIEMMPEHYVEVSIKNVDFDLNKEEIAERLKGETTYRTTRFLLLNRNDDWAIVKINKKREAKLFPRIVGIKVLALPEDTAFEEREDIDVHNRTLMGRVASSRKEKAVVVKGRFGHVSFIIDEPVLNIRVLDVVPPQSRLMILAEEVLRIAPIKRAVNLVPELIDLSGLISEVETEFVVLPCRASELTSPKKHFFLDENPKITDEELKNITLVGCRLSKNIFRSVYKRDPLLKNICPKDLMKDDGLTLTRCCMYEEVRVEGNTVFVPWGATVQDINYALKKLVGIAGS